MKEKSENITFKNYTFFLIVIVLFFSLNAQSQEKQIQPVFSDFVYTGDDEVYKNFPL